MNLKFPTTKSVSTIQLKPANNVLYESVEFLNARMALVKVKASELTAYYMNT